ncbi:class I adenylate-forming enzyme family protein [Nocardia sp. XZ_19_385]|uniref:class I adenylate-forming enzyme family protein n=1 Tax=Nocardia sp. XZ_19_385 TaxID=2769488 RepID=UPI00188FBF56|nr:long-chain fatty acid--CoA ligase [Nocardia sp. XZ_19_385]
MATIGATLRSTAKRVPDREALVFGDHRYTYAELDAQVDRVAGVLAAQGIRKGDRLALMATNSDRFVIVFYAAHRLGAIFVPVNPGSAAPELDYLVRDSDAAALVFDAAVAPTVRKAVENGLAETLRTLAMSEIDGFPDLFASAAAYDGPVVEAAVEETDDAQILYTSGTTGSPKGALFDHHRELWVGMGVMATAGLRDGDRLLHVAPLYHAAELCMLIIPGTMVGATHIVQSGFDPMKVADALERERITLLFGVPTMYQFLLRVPDLAQRDLSTWRTAIYGAAPMPASAVEQLLAALPQVQFMQACGQTEAGPGGIFANHAQVCERPDASGRQALPMMECRIVDLDGNDVQPGEVGELLLRGETLMKGYWNKPEATADAIRDGWLHTGDLARLDADGYMTLVDRLKDMIITGGRNVYSVEVENAIAAHPDILDVAIIARQHAEYGESIVAIAVLKEGAALDLDALREFCAERIAAYKLPHDLVITEQIPRNPSGKILKRTLRERFAAVSS